jgi:hypothetical protein
VDTLASKEVVDHILEHHGVKGMRWGVSRRGGSSGSSSSEVTVKTRSHPQAKTVIKTKGGRGLPAHPDAISAKVVTQKLKKSGMHTLSNKELQNLATRTNLEQQIHRSGVGEGTVQKGLKQASSFLKTPEGQTAVSEASKAVTSDSGRKLIKHLAKGVRLAAVVA